MFTPGEFDSNQVEATSQKQYKSKGLSLEKEWGVLNSFYPKMKYLI